MITDSLTHLPASTATRSSMTITTITGVAELLPDPPETQTRFATDGRGWLTGSALPASEGSCAYLYVCTQYACMRAYARTCGCMHMESIASFGGRGCVLLYGQRCRTHTDSNVRAAHIVACQAHMGPRAGKHEAHMGPRAGELYESRVPRSERPAPLQCPYMHTCTCTHTHIGTHIRACIHARICICTHARMRTCAHACTVI